MVDALEQKNRNFFLYQMIPDIVEKVALPRTGESLVALLERGGAQVADIGCGCGTSTIALAQRFPNSQLYACELSTKSLDIREQRIQELGISNIVVCNVSSRPVSDGPYLLGDAEKGKHFFDVCYTHDVLHDMTNPKALFQDVQKQLSKNGCWIIVDVKCHEHLSDNLAMPTAALNYGFSCLLCLACATSSSSHSNHNNATAGLGTLGFHSKLARRWMLEAGFEHFSEREIQSKPDNSCFIVA